jgi:thymidylate kinase
MKPNFSRISDFPGRLIILEGPDGSGKSTQAKKLKKMLMAQGQIAVITTWKDAPFFREYFVEHESKKTGEGVTPEAHLLLQVADFLYQIERKVVPNLLKGHTVIMDRALPTIVIRGLSLGHTLDQLENGLLWFKNTIYKDLFDKATTVYLDVPAAKTLERIKKRSKKQDEGEGTLLSFQMINNLKYLPDGEKLTKKAKRRLVEKLQETYITSYGHYFSHHDGIKVDANKSSEEVLNEIWTKLAPVSPKKSETKFQVSRLKKTK